MYLLGHLGFGTWPKIRERMSVGFPGKVGLAVKNPPAYAGDAGLIPGEENGIPLQYSCLRNTIDGGAWQATVHGVIKSQTGLSY